MSPFDSAIDIVFYDVTFSRHENLSAEDVATIVQWEKSEHSRDAIVAFCKKYGVRARVFDMAGSIRFTVSAEGDWSPV